MRSKSKYPQLANVVFLDKVGETLRQATADITRAELPEDILLLLRRLERIERKESLKRPDDLTLAQVPGGNSGR
ncbi:MAG: hypothetical protein ABW200_03445 [Hyphomicrobiaceae bacterium]|jgi:hypothetical protein